MTIADYGFAVWETFYVTLLSTAFSLVIGLPLGVLLVAGDKDGILPLPGWLMHLLNIIINILRSVPFLILMICVFPLSRAIVGTTSALRRPSCRWSARRSPLWRVWSRPACGSWMRAWSKPPRAWARPRSRSSPRL